MPYGVRTRSGSSSAFTTLDGGAAKGYVVERTVAMQLCPTVAGWRGEPCLPSQAYKFSFNLTEKAYRTCGQAASALHAMALLQVYQAKTLMEMPQDSLDKQLLGELSTATNLALQVTKVMTLLVGQAKATFETGRHEGDR